MSSTIFHRKVRECGIVGLNLPQKELFSKYLYDDNIIVYYLLFVFLLKNPYLEKNEKFGCIIMLHYTYLKEN